MFLKTYISNNYFKLLQKNKYFWKNKIFFTFFYHYIGNYLNFYFFENFIHFKFYILKQNIIRSILIYQNQISDKKFISYISNKLSVKIIKSLIGRSSGPIF